jgi:hypothetical protein
MDANEFDQLVRRLGEIASRRGVVKGTAATVAGAAIAHLSGEGGEAQENQRQRFDAENCTPDGQVCGKRRGRGRSVKPCRRCCSRYAKGKGKRKRCRCRPAGRKCAPSKGYQCCSGYCTDDRRCGLFAYGGRAAG